MTVVKISFQILNFRYFLEQDTLATKIDEIEKWKENHVLGPIYFNGQKQQQQVGTNKKLC